MSVFLTKDRQPRRPNRLQAWPPDADDPEERLRNLFEGCAEELLPPSRTGTSRGREARTVEEVEAGNQDMA